MRKLIITDDVLDKLGFSEYWDEHGTYGTRTLRFDDGTKFIILEQEEMDDSTEGYGDGMYVAHHFRFEGHRNGMEGVHELFFLHQMYECIEKYFPSYLDEFVEKCEKVKMKPYIDDFLRERKNK